MSLFSARPLQDDSNASGRYSDKRSSSSSSSSRSTRGHSRKTKSNDAIFDFFLTMHGKLDDMNNKSTSKPQQKKKKGRRYSTSTTHAAHQLNLSPISVNQHPSQARLAKRRQFRQQARLSSYSHGNDIPTRSQSDLFYLESTVGSTDMESSGNDQEYGYLSHSDADGESSDLNY
jgi:hypothetical protein